MASLSNVKYLLSHDPKPPVEAWEMVHQEGDVYVFRNNNTDSIGKFYTKTVTSEVYDSKRDGLEQWDLLPEVLITQEATPYDVGAEGLDAYAREEVKEPFDRDRLDLAHYHMLDDGAAFDGVGTVVIPISAEKRASCRNMTVRFDVESDTSGAIWIYVNDERGYEHFNVGKQGYRISVPADTEQITIRADNDELKMNVTGIRFYGSDADRSFSDEAKIDMHFEGDDAHLAGTIEAQKDGIVMLAIPMEEGWKVTVDGQEAPLTRADYLYMSFPVSAGSHAIEAVYTSPRFFMSAMISLGACVLWLAAVVLTWLAGRKKQA